MAAPTAQVVRRPSGRSSVCGPSTVGGGLEIGGGGGGGAAVPGGAGETGAGGGPAASLWMSLWMVSAMMSTSASETSRQDLPSTCRELDSPLVSSTSARHAAPSTTTRALASSGSRVWSADGPTPTTRATASSNSARVGHPSGASHASSTGGATGGSATATPRGHPTATRTARRALHALAAADEVGFVGEASVKSYSAHFPTGGSGPSTL